MIDFKLVYEAGKGTLMKIKNGAEYIESLRKVKPIIYYKG